MKRPIVPVSRLGFPSADEMWALWALVAAVRELISPTGELNLHLSGLGLQDLRKLADDAARFDAREDDE